MYCSFGGSSYSKQNVDLSFSGAEGNVGLCAPSPSSLASPRRGFERGNRLRPQSVAVAERGPGCRTAWT